MALNLIKLCVGCDSIDDLAEWIDVEARRDAPGEGQAGAVPRHPHGAEARTPELLDGGSLYWVIKGNVQVRQRLLDIRPFAGEDGIGRCRLVLDRKLVRHRMAAEAAVPGLALSEAKDAPPDLKAGRADDLPQALRAELAQLGLR